MHFNNILNFEQPYFDGECNLCQLEARLDHLARLVNNRVATPSNDSELDWQYQVRDYLKAIRDDLISIQSIQNDIIAPTTLETDHD